jgi:hypothetical protein
VKKWLQELIMAIALIVFSLTIYSLHFYIFHDMRHIMIYFIGDIAFLGVQALIAYFAIDRLLSYREKMATMKKLNMLAGIFFYDLGIKVFNTLTGLVIECKECQKHICIEGSWTNKDFQKRKKALPRLQIGLRYDPKVLQELTGKLQKGKDLIIRLMENPSLHEHEIFSDMLLAIFHLTEELLRRDSLAKNSPEDKQHLINDTKRAYIYLAQLWLEYMQHLKDNYKYLYLYNIKNRQLTLAVNS